jgi:hypothetical protein
LLLGSATHSPARLLAEGWHHPGFAAAAELLSALQLPLLLLQGRRGALLLHVGGLVGAAAAVGAAGRLQGAETCCLALLGAQGLAWVLHNLRDQQGESQQ